MRRDEKHNAELRMQLIKNPHETCWRIVFDIVGSDGEQLREPLTVVLPSVSDNAIRAVAALSNELKRRDLSLNDLPQMSTPELNKLFRNGLSAAYGRALEEVPTEQLMEGVHEFLVVAHAIYAAFRGPSKTSYPRFWELLRFILGHRLREQVFEPAYNDLLADHLTTRAARFQTPWARRWIKLCFATRTVWLVGQCAAVALRGTAAAVLIPRWLREWLGR